MMISRLTISQRQWTKMMSWSRTQRCSTISCLELRRRFFLGHDKKIERDLPDEDLHSLMDPHQMLLQPHLLSQSRSDKLRALQRERITILLKNDPQRILVDHHHRQLKPEAIPVPTDDELVIDEVFVVANEGV